MTFYLERPESRRYEAESSPSLCREKLYNGDCNGRYVKKTASLFGSVHSTRRPCRIPYLTNQLGMSESPKLIQNKRNCSDSSPPTLVAKHRLKVQGSERDARVKMLISLYNRTPTQSPQFHDIEQEGHSPDHRCSSSQVTSTKHCHDHKKKTTFQPVSAKKLSIPTAFVESPSHSFCMPAKSAFEVNFLSYSKNNTSKPTNVHQMQRRHCLGSLDQNNLSKFKGILQPTDPISRTSCQNPYYPPHIFQKGNKNRNAYDTNKFNDAGMPVYTTNTNESSYFCPQEKKLNQSRRADLMTGMKYNTYSSGATPQQSNLKCRSRTPQFVKNSPQPLKCTKEDIIDVSKYPSGSRKTGSLNGSIRSNKKLEIKSELLNESNFPKVITQERQHQTAPCNSIMKPYTPTALKKCNNILKSNDQNVAPLIPMARDSKCSIYSLQQCKTNVSKDFASPVQCRHRSYTASQPQQPVTVLSSVENHSRPLGKKSYSRLTFNEGMNNWGHNTSANISKEDDSRKTPDPCRNLHKVINGKKVMDHEMNITGSDDNMRRGNEGLQKCSNISSCEGARRRSPTLTRSDSSIENETAPAPIPQSWVSRVVGYFERITGSANSTNLNAEEPKKGSNFADEDDKICTVVKPDEAHLDTKGSSSDHEWREQRSNRPKLQRSFSLPRQPTQGLRTHQKPKRRASKSSFHYHPQEYLRSASHSHRTSYESLLAFKPELESIKKLSLDVSDQEKGKSSTIEGQSNCDNSADDWCKGTNAINKTIKTMEVDDTVYRTKNCLIDSCHYDSSEPYSPNDRSKSFRHAVYGSIYGDEGHCMTSDYIMGCTDGSDAALNSSENSDTSSGLESSLYDLHMRNSSDECLGYDSGYVEENEVKKPKNDHKVHSCPSIMELVSNKEKRWCEIAEIANSEFFHKLTSNQRKIQEAKFEVITSETTYIRMLNVLISHFLESETLKDERIISKEDRGILFSNFVAVKNCSERFLADLELSWQDDFSLQDLDEVIHEHAQKNFGVYITYCHNQAHQICTLNKLMESEVFARAIDELESHPICRKRTLQCYMIMPMQRVTRIRLLVETILARLSHENPKHQGWKLACDALNKVVKQCNEAAKQAALMEEKKILSEKLNFRRFEQVNLDSRERYLVHWGEVRHLCSSNDAAVNHSGILPTPSNNNGYRKLIKQPFTFGRKLIKQPLYLLLFTDLVIVTKKKSDEKFIVLDCSPRCMVDVLNGDPSSLHEVTQKSYTEEWRNVFHLFIRKDREKGWIEMILSASNESEKDRWLEAFETI